MRTFDSFGVMIDCSRNAVMRPEQVKKYMGILSKMGYNMVELYTEETFEVKDEPYFGYMRGRYTQKELKELDTYAQSVGIELMPCVQTLAHLESIFRWQEYVDIRDLNDILLVGEERTYRLIDNIFRTLAECFTSRRVNIGMDEAHMLGLGKYFEKHGLRNRFDIIYEHLLKVLEIADKYGFTCFIWSDMFFRIANRGEYYTEKEIDIPDEIIAKVPKNLELIYWDYYHTDKATYDNMLNLHQKFGSPVWFAGGAWAWKGFAPSNGFSFRTTKPAMESCVAHDVKNILITMWGDNGGECSRFSVLPALLYAIETYRGNTDLEDIKAKFKEITGEDFDAFAALDLPDAINGNQGDMLNPCKYLLYSDPFNCFLEPTLAGGEGEQFAKISETLAGYAETSEFSYLFETLSSLCRTLADKSGLGIATRDAYRRRDEKALTALIARYDRVTAEIEVFVQAFRKQWFTDNKPCGFDVQELRLGGLLMRMRSCKERLQAFLDGEIDKIEELEEKLLPYNGNAEKRILCYNGWSTNATNNVV